MNFSQQLNIIKTLVPSGEVDTRMDCPFCSGTNTLTIKRNNSDSAVLENDKLRYQTVFANTEGAVAASTAGLHLTNELLDEIE